MFSDVFAAEGRLRVPPKKFVNKLRLYFCCTGLSGSDLEAVEKCTLEKFLAFSGSLDRWWNSASERQ